MLRCCATREKPTRLCRVTVLHLSDALLRPYDIRGGLQTAPTRSTSKAGGKPFASPSLRSRAAAQGKPRPYYLALPSYGDPSHSRYSFANRYFRAFLEGSAISLQPCPTPSDST